MVHLVRIASIEGRIAERDHLIDRIIELSPDGDSALPMRALRAFARNDTAEIATVTTELERARALTIGIAFSDIALYSGNPGAAEELGRTFLRSVRADDLRALCHIVLAHLLAGSERWDEARAELAAAQPLEPAWALEVRALMAALPFAPTTATELASVRGQLEQWDATATRPSHNLAFATHNDLHPHLRQYLLGLLAIRAGDLAAGRTAVEQLERLEWPANSSTFISNLVLSLRAAIAWSEHDAGAALRILEGMRLEVWFQLTVASPFFSQGFDRYLRGEVLMALGRIEEGKSWFAALDERSPFELLYRGVAEKARRS
jgi:hypothetical protein